MTKYTAAQIQAAISEDYSYENDFFEEVDREGTELPSLKVTAYAVSREGGHEGDGDYMDVVFRVDNQLFRQQGYHNSWDSNDWDGDLQEVEAYEEVVTKYRAIK